MNSPLCEWSELPEDQCTHCIGGLSSWTVVCNHGRIAPACLKCSSGAPREDRGTRPERHTLTAMQMGAFRIQETEYDVVLGPCPGCQLWQIDYTNAVAQQFFTLDVETQDVEELGSFEPVDTLSQVVVNTRPFHDVIEDALAEHLEECPHLQKVLAEAEL